MGDVAVFGKKDEGRQRDSGVSDVESGCEVEVFNAIRDGQILLLCSSIDLVSMYVTGIHVDTH